jgi:hypothetical protein
MIARIAHYEFMITYIEGISFATVPQTGGMKTAAVEPGPAVSRLCIAIAGAGIPGPLTLIQRSGGFYRLYLKTDSAGTEFAVASPGIDEVSLITDLIAAIGGQVMIPGLGPPVIAGFHVGIIRLIGECFGGTGAERVLALIRHPAVLEGCARALARTGATSPLAVTVTAGLFEELRAEGLPDHGWEPVPSAGAWLRPFDAAPAAAAR